MNSRWSFLMENDQYMCDGLCERHSERFVGILFKTFVLNPSCFWTLSVLLPAFALAVSPHICSERAGERERGRGEWERERERVSQHKIVAVFDIPTTRKLGFLCGCGRHSSARLGVLERRHHRLMQPRRRTPQAPTATTWLFLSRREKRKP